MIVIIDYGMGNLGSIQNMLKKIGYVSEITSRVERIEQASKLILPGVGAFDRAVTNLDQLGLIPIIRSKAIKGTPILGICLGMQLLAESSEEGILPGLGLIPGKVVRFVLPKQHKVPHMGWNVVRYDEDSSLYKGFGQFEEARFYFVHSFHFICQNERNVSGETTYGITFSSSVGRENVLGVQFHPEKSHKYGMLLLKNFVTI